MTNEQRRELVLAAIDRIKAAEKLWRDTELSASATSQDRADALTIRSNVHVEFAWQWENVEALLRTHDEERRDWWRQEALLRGTEGE